MIRTNVLLLVFFAALAPAYAAPCTKATAECTEWVKLGGQAQGLVYRTYSLDAKNDRVTRALIVVHGQGRDADNYFRTALAATFLAGAFEDTIVIAPRFASNSGTGCRDPLAPNEVNWSCSGDSWRSGGVSISNKELTSYDFMDEILRQLSRKAVFPNLKGIVLTGHSAGGQYVTRYEMANRSEEHTSELQSRSDLVCRLLLEKKKTHLSAMDHQPHRGRNGCQQTQRHSCRVRLATCKVPGRLICAFSK